MEIPKIVILLCCAYQVFASHEVHEGHTIPVEHYETELHNLGEHVEQHETPVKVIKITKTVAVKIPVPYPVKVIQKVPYPVHISKPYPVPVPQIVKVPHGHDSSNDDLLHRSGQEGKYQVHDIQSPEGLVNGNTYDSGIQSYNGGQSDHPQTLDSYNVGYSSDGSSGNSYEESPQSYYGSAGNEADSFETSKSYDEAIQNYLQNIKSGGNAGHGLQNYNNYH